MFGGAGVVLLLIGVPYACSTLRAWRARALHAKWMEYEAPQGQVVYEEDPAAAADLIARGGGGYFVLRAGDDGSAAAVAAETSAEFPVVHFPPDAAALRARIPGGCAFLHWLRAGELETLVYVSLRLGPADAGDATGRTVVLTPYRVDADDAARGGAAPSPAGAPVIVHLKARDRLRVFAGQRDVGDAAHFAIEYVKADRGGTIHGVLNRDGSVGLSTDRTELEPVRR
jgi:hypothetical protein